MVHHRPWRRCQVLAHRELRGVHAGREARRRRHVPQQVPHPLDEVGAAVVDRRLQRGRVGPREVRRRQGISNILDREPQLLIARPVELSVADQILSGGQSSEIGLRDPPKQPAVLRGRIGEAPSFGFGKRCDAPVAVAPSSAARPPSRRATRRGLRANLNIALAAGAGARKVERIPGASATKTSKPLRTPGAPRGGSG
jgi:hypothetical protein